MATVSEIEAIQNQLKEVWDTAVKQETIHIRPRINKVVADLDQATIEQIRPFLERLYQKSDRRVLMFWTYMAYQKGAVFGFDEAKAKRLIDEGYGSGDKAKQSGLKKLAERSEEAARNEYSSRMTAYQNHPH